MFVFQRSILPTADLYLHASMDDFISKIRLPFNKKPIIRLGPHLYACNGQALLVRYATKMELRRIKKISPEHCAWLIDDNLWALEDDELLPEDYKMRLITFREKVVPHILNVCDTVISPSRYILKNFSLHNTLLLNPSFISVCQDFSHFNNPFFTEAAFTGTRSHLPDLSAIAEVLRTLIEKNPRLRLTTFLGRHAPAVLQGHERILNLPPMPWQRYRKIMGTRRFHLGIAVFRDTLFNRSRSLNKVLDHAAFGAAGVYAAAPPFANVITHGRNGVLLGPGTDLQATLQALLNDMETLRKVAENGASLALKLGNPAHNRDFWMEYFRLKTR